MKYNFFFLFTVIEPTSINERSEYSPSRLSGRISASAAPAIEEIQENNHSNYTDTQPDTNQVDNNPSACDNCNQTDSAYSSTDKSDSKSDSFVIEEQPFGGVPRQYSQPELF